MAKEGGGEKQNSKKISGTVGSLWFIRLDLEGVQIKIEYKIKVQGN